MSVDSNVFFVTNRQRVTVQRHGHAVFPLIVRFRRGSSRCPRSLSGSSTPPSGLEETATPAGRKGFTKSFANWIARSRMPFDSLVALLADVDA